MGGGWFFGCFGRGSGRGSGSGSGSGGEGGGWWGVGEEVQVNKKEEEDKKWPKRPCEGSTQRRRTQGQCSKGKSQIQPIAMFPWFPAQEQERDQDPRKKKYAMVVCMYVGVLASQLCHPIYV